MESLNDLVAEIEALHQKATPGPWYECIHNEIARRASDGTLVRLVSFSELDEDNPALVVALRNAWPRLREEIERLGSRVADANDELTRIHGLASEVSNADAQDFETALGVAVMLLERATSADALRAENERRAGELRSLREELRKDHEEREILWNALGKPEGTCTTTLATRVAVELERLRNENISYRENLGDIVTFGTTAESLDRQLREVIAERDALRAENERLRANLAANIVGAEVRVEGRRP